MTETHPFEDTQLFGTGDLALFLGGSEDSFTGLLLVLITKAQSTPANYSRLKSAFPREVRAWETWMGMTPVPTFRELREALQEQDAPLLAFDWGALEAARFLPRVRVGRTLLSLARGRLDSIAFQTMRPAARISSKIGNGSATSAGSAKSRS